MANEPVNVVAPVDAGAPALKAPPGVSSTNSGADFAANFLNSLMQGAAPATDAGPAPVSAPLVPTGPQDIRADMIGPSVAPPAPVPAPVPVPTPPAPAPVPVPAATVPPTPAPLSMASPVSAPQVDYANRYGQESTAAQELSPLPELPPEPQITMPSDGQQIPNAAFAAIRSDYGKMRHMATDFRNRYNQLVEDTKKFQGEKAEFAAQLNAKDEEIKKLTDEIGRMDLSRSPEFHEKYDVPLRAVTDEVTRLLTANGIGQEEAGEIAKDVVTADPQDIPDKISNLPTHVQGMIMYQAQEADKLWSARARALDDWRQSAEGLAAVAARGSAIVSAQRTQQLADAAIKIVKGMSPDKGLPPAFQVMDPAFVADREAKEQQFRAWVQNAPEEQKMAAMFEGWIAPMTYQMTDDVYKENLRLKQMLYTRTRVDAPPIVAMAAPAPDLRPGATMPVRPATPPPAPTVQNNGWSYADTGTAAQAFAQQLVNSMQGQRNLPGM